MENKLSINNSISNKDKLKLIQKAVLTGIGVAASKESIKKAAAGIYKDVQQIVQNLLSELEESGEIKTQEAKNIIKQLQKKSELEKAKIYKKLQKEGKVLLKSVKEILKTPVSLLQEVTKSLYFQHKSSNKTNKKTRRRKKKK